MFLQFIVNGIIAGSIYALIAIGFTVIYRTVKFFHFAHGIVYTAGAYIAYTLIISLQLNFVLSFFLSIILSAILGIAIDRLVYYPLRKQTASNLIFRLASFGVVIFLQNLIQLIYGAQILTIRTGPIKEGHQFLGAVITDIQILILAVSIFLMILLWLFIQKTKLGKAMRAMSDKPMVTDVLIVASQRSVQCT